MKLRGCLQQALQIHVDDSSPIDAIESLSCTGKIRERLLNAAELVVAADEPEPVGALATGCLAERLPATTQLPTGASGQAL
jgi:hypothetical protein